MVAAIIDNAPLFQTGVFVFGLLIGSFLNVVILRLPARLEFHWRCECRELLEIPDTTKRQAPPGVIWERSRCRTCGHQISPWENIPVLSFVFLGGRCSACKARIALRYPLVELLTAVLFVVTASHFEPGMQLLAGLVLTGFLIALTGIDIDHQLLPDNLTLPLLWTGLLLSLFGVFVDPATSITGAIAGYLSLWSIYHLFRMLTGKEGMGYGDFKLLAALGAWMGWQMLPLIILLASLVGAVVGLALMTLRLHHKDQPIPFGPYIAAAGWIAMLWGDRIIAQYLRASGMG
jgi:leader peptidase (prepilin peptidase)/N-methyltransferase